MMNCRHLLLLLPCLVWTYGHAQPATVLGRTVNLTPPPGYCAIGSSPRQAEFIRRLEALQQAAGILLQATAPCPDLKRFDAGAIDEFTRQAIVMVVKAKGQLRLDPRSQTDFLRSFGPLTPIDLAQVNARLQQATHPQPVTGSLRSMTPLGSDGKAFYWGVIGEVQADGGQSLRVTTVGAAMLVNGLPLSVQASAREDSGRDIRVGDITSQHVQAIAAKN